MGGNVENLFVCTTTFQLFISKKIIQTKNIKNYEVVYLKKNINSKDLSVLSSIKKKKIISSNLMFLLYIFLCNFNTVKNIYIASINEFKVWFLCSSIHFNKIFSFDDGTANYVSSGYFFEERNLTSKEIYILKLFRVKIRSLDSMKSKIDKHYGLINSKNIIDNVELINFVVRCRNQTNKGNKVRKIFVGPYFSEFFIDDEDIKKLFFSLLTCNDSYFPHPRESQYSNFMIQDKLNKFESIDEYIDTLLNEGYSRIELYGFANTTQLLYSSHKEIYIYVLKANSIKRRFSDGYIESITLLEKVAFNKVNYIFFSE